jgi:DNA-binding LytR/AlgR family response regulator
MKRHAFAKVQAVEHRIILIEATYAEPYSMIHLDCGKKQIIALSIGRLHKELTNKDLLRINKSNIVNLRHFEIQGNKAIRGGQSYEFSRRKFKEFISLIF